jgi:phage shock protein E
MNSFIRNNRLTLIGIVLGLIVGYLYYHFVGCASGTCPITSKPLNSTLYGALLGGLLFNAFQKTPNTNQK